VPVSKEANMQKLLTPSELAELTGLALQTIYNRHSTGGSLPPTIRLGNRLRFRMPDVESWLEECSGPNAGAPRADAPTSPRPPGRPKKADQIARRIRHKR
jgi:predicted DNA-binding transcriptional regulator AlpA